MPILKYAGGSAATGLREGGRTASEGRERHRARNTLVVVQVALAFVLLICSGLMIRTFHALTQRQPRLPDHRRDADLPLLASPSRKSRIRSRSLHTEEQILRKVAAIPGVTRRGSDQRDPDGRRPWNDPVFAQDHDVRVR